MARPLIAWLIPITASGAALPAVKTEWPSPPRRRIADLFASNPDAIRIEARRYHRTVQTWWRDLREGASR
jgi:hypothetical protein